MKEILSKKAAGFYFAALAGLVAIVAIIRYVAWAPAHNAMNSLILVALVLGLVIDIVLIFYDNNYLIVAATACYSVALFQLLADSVGSFVDLFQGIVMFGDSTQVGTIISISCFIAVSILASVVASFMKRVRA
ncbi:MAG TPA: hypothetical protein GXX75_03645 [Clostridiales bacterium]|nr:hypothetical protein [Clostridiales bacterium]